MCAIFSDLLSNISTNTMDVPDFLPGKSGTVATQAGGVVSWQTGRGPGATPLHATLGSMPAHAHKSIRDVSEVRTTVGEGDG